MQLTVVSQSDAIVRLEAAGRLVQSELEAFDPLQAAIGDDDYSRGVLLGLADVEYIDSSGIGWLLARHKRFREAGGKLVLHSASSTVMDVVKMLRLNTVFHLADDEMAAVTLAQGDDS